MVAALAGQMFPVLDGDFTYVPWKKSSRLYFVESVHLLFLAEEGSAIIVHIEAAVVWLIFFELEVGDLIFILAALVWHLDTSGSPCSES